MEQTIFTSERSTQTIIEGNKITILKGDKVNVNYKTKPLPVSFTNEMHNEIIGAEILLNDVVIGNFNQRQMIELDEFLTLFKA